MAGLDSPQLKIIQLECIIASKDKELSVLREQLSQDQEVGTSEGVGDSTQQTELALQRAAKPCCLMHTHHVTLSSK